MTMRLSGNGCHCLRRRLLFETVPIALPAEKSVRDLLFEQINGSRGDLPHDGSASRDLGLEVFRSMDTRLLLPTEGAAASRSLAPEPYGGGHSIRLKRSCLRFISSCNSSAYCLTLAPTKR
jgi:hypothetical protein